MKLRALTATLFTAAVLAGCASAPSAPETAATPEAAIAQRAQARWDFLVAKNFDQAYTYITPAYRSLQTPQQYASRFGSGAAWKSAQVEKVSCESAQRCTATIKLEVVVLARGFTKPLESRMTETWLHDEGQWWFYQKD